MNPGDESDTIDYSSPVPRDNLGLAPPVSSRTLVDVAALSHPGNVRTNNEDHYLVVRIERALQTLLTNLPQGIVPDQFNEIGYGMLVADGMGGMAAGEVASQLAIGTLVNLALNTSDWIMRLGKPQAETVMRRMAERYGLIDDVLREQALNDPSLSGMGTTMTLACSVGRDLVLAHVGDSRAYLLRAGALHQLTRDHTVAQALMDKGILREADVLTNEFRHVLTRALGAGRARSQPDVQHASLTSWDQVLLCSDGLTGCVSDATLSAVLQNAGSSSDACQMLIERALTNGGKDNVTVVLARYRFLPEG